MKVRYVLRQSGGTPDRLHGVLLARRDRLAVNAVCKVKEKAAVFAEASRQQLAAVKRQDRRLCTCRAI